MKRQRPDYTEIENSTKFGEFCELEIQ